MLDAGLFWLGSGLPDPDLSLAASLALFAAYGLEQPAALNGPQYLRDSILVEPLRVAGDLAQLPTGLGLGVEVDEPQIDRLLARGEGSENPKIACGRKMRALMDIRNTT